MTVEKELARVAAIVEQIPDALKEIKASLSKMDERQVSHHIRIDRLEQTEKRRSKWTGIVLTAWVGLLVTWVWERMK